MIEGEYPRVSDEDREKLVVRLRDSAHFILTAADEEDWSETDLTRGISHLALQAATEIEDARALLRDAAEHLMWADAAIQRAEEVPDTPERVVDLLEGARAEIIALRARIEGGAS